MNILMPELEFDPIEHVYTYRGQVIEGVTTILDRAGLIPHNHHGQVPRERGRLLHQAIEYAALDDLNEDTLDPALRGYVMAWRKFMRNHRVKPIAIEVVMAHPELSYGGTIDMIAKMENQVVGIDFKTGVPMPWHDYQLAGYEMLTNRNCDLLPIHAVVPIWFDVYLNQDGDYRIGNRLGTRKSPYHIFNAAHICAHARMQNGG